jgi:hypothetical protein
MMAVAQNCPTYYWSIPQSNYQDPYVTWAYQLANYSTIPLVHSISYGGPEYGGSSSTALNNELIKLGNRGATVVVASGDDGVANFVARGHPEQCGYRPSWPATSPYVTVSLLMYSFYLMFRLLGQLKDQKVELKKLSALQRQEEVLLQVEVSPITLLDLAIKITLYIIIFKAMEVNQSLDIKLKVEEFLMCLFLVKLMLLWMEELSTMRVEPLLQLLYLVE